MKNYYNEVNTLIEELEVNKRYRKIKDNSDTLRTYWEIGRLIVAAQGGKSRAKYGNNFLQEWGKEYSYRYGKNYDISSLKRIRKFYLLFPKGAPVGHLSWKHIKYILPIKSENERNYYINQVNLNYLSSNDLNKLIKSKAFDRLSYADKENIELITDVDNAQLTIEDMIKDPILIKVDKTMDKLNEKALHRYIIDMLEDKFLRAW